jgi:hypothetical protein
MLATERRGAEREFWPLSELGLLLLPNGGLTVERMMLKTLSH